MVIGETAIEEAQQLVQLSWKIVGAEGLARTPQRQRGERIRARSSAEPEIDAAGMKRFEHAERFGHFQRRMVGQHHAARADADAPGHCGHMADHHLGHGAGDERRVVMLGKPVPRVAQRVGKLRQVERVAQRIGARRTGWHRRNVQHRQAIRPFSCHAFAMEPRGPHTKKRLA